MSVLDESLRQDAPALTPVAPRGRASPRFGPCVGPQPDEPHGALQGAGLPDVPPLIGPRGAPSNPQPCAVPATDQPGRVTLVGAGPGDPELLTVKAERALRNASLVLYDHLVGREVLELLPADATRIYVGKQSGHHILSQQAIIELMLRLARSGRALVRLKGGDPYIFGRGGEEAQALAAAGVPFEVIPGISAAQGAAALAGMPLTHRDHACSVIFATGHLRQGRHDGDVEHSVDLDWALLARPRQTVVVYMGVGALPVICAQLAAHGLDADTPAATVERATRPDQRTVVGTLRTLPALARSQGVKAPALIIIGGVVSLHAVLAQAPASVVASV